MAPKKRTNWAALSAFCIGLGVLLTLGASIAFTQESNITGSARSDLVTTKARGEDSPKFPGIDPIRPAPTGDASAPAAIVDEDVILSRAAPVNAVPTALPARVTSAIDTTSDTSSSSGISVAQAAPSFIPESTGSTQSTAPGPNADEPPPNAAAGMTYCGTITCNVGLKCCCDRCTAADEPCAEAACEAYTGLSVSVACGMDTCTPGEICCDARCGACAVAGECPVEACGT